MLRIEPLTSLMINQVLNQWTTPSKGVQFLLIFKISNVIFTLHYKIMRYEGKYVIGDRWVGGWVGR
jgi:hypothetical protein